MANIKEITDYLKGFDENTEINLTLSNPHSNRGDYSNIGFNHSFETGTVKGIIEELTYVIGKTFYGYKGGEFEMCEYSEVYLSEYGGVGEPLTLVLLEVLLTK